MYDTERSSLNLQFRARVFNNLFCGIRKGPLFLPLPLHSGELREETVLQVNPIVWWLGTELTQLKSHGRHQLEGSRDRLH